MEEGREDRKRAGGCDRQAIDDLLSGTFNSILRIEERSLDNRLTSGLTITEVHTIVAVGLYERNPMNVVAARLSVTTATLTTAVGKLERKGFIERTRAADDRRKVLLSLTKKGRLVYRAHSLFHRQMVDEALEGLTDEEERVFTEALIKVKAFFDERA
ncbi:MAG TPA: MarR family transcriptional regulator [Candidatus Aphodovivens avistercoris]|nr:MarR family transcriptional regulator [Candidatus Aphodovivens avistercoris]